jgi:hypothetical protein
VLAGTLQIEMMANMARLANDMRQAKDMVGGAMDHINRSVGIAKGALATLGVGLSFGALAAGIKGVVDSAAMLDDLSEKTGASVEQLSKLDQVARIGGHSTEIFETALVRLSKSLHSEGDEARGAGKALAALGLSQDALRNKDTAESLRIVAVELAKYEDGAGKTALATDLLGKSGAQALPFLKDLATEQGIAARVTTEQAAAAEELQKSLKRIRLESENAKQALVLDLVPGMLRLLTVLVDTRRETGSFALSLNAMTSAQFFGKDSAEQIRTITKALADLNEQQRIYNGFVAKPLLGVRESNLLAALQAAKAFQRQEALALPGGDTRGEMQRFGLPGVKLMLNYEAAAKAAKDAASKVMTLDELLLRNHQKRLQAQEEAEREFTRVAEHEEAERLAATQKSMEGQIALGRRLHDEDLKAAAYFRDEIQAIADQHKKVSDDTTEFWREAARNMQNAMSDLFFDVMQGKLDSFGSKLKSTVDRMIANNLAGQANTALFGKDFEKGGALGGLLGKGLDWLKGTQAPAPVVDLFPSMIGNAASEQAAAAAFSATVTSAGALFSTEVAGAGAAFLPEITSAGAVFTTEMTTAGTLLGTTLTGTGAVFSAEVAAAGAAFAAEVAAAGAVSSAGSAVGGIGGYASLFASLFAAGGYAFDNGILPFARGGIVDAPTRFRFADGGAMRDGIMGEAGPEAIMPLKRINGQLGVSAEGGGAANIEIHNTYHIDSRSDRAEIVSMIERSRQQTVRDVADAARRGGAYRRAVRG